MGYAVAYPFGIFGIIISMILLRMIFKINIPNEVEQYKKELTGVSGKLVAINVEISNQNLIGKSIDFLITTCNKDFVLSRIERKGEFFATDAELIIEQGDKLYGVSSEASFDQIELNMGTINKNQRAGNNGTFGNETSFNYQ